MVGAGQLARMTHQAAIALGQSLRMLAESADDAAAMVGSDVQVGDYRSLSDLRDFAASCDVLTFDHEHVPGEHLRALAADGVTVLPSANALRFAQNKADMRRRLAELKLAAPAWRDLSAVADPRAELADFAAGTGWPLVLKAISGGYDGKGVWVVESMADAEPLLASGTPLLAEAKVELDFEIAAVVARSPFGQGAAWTPVETVQQNGICTEVIAPAPRLSAEQAETAQQLALRIAAELDVVGVLAVELFVERGGGLLVNELAMRPHNSGHWGMDGAVTGQFEQHLRAVLDYPLGATTPLAPVTVMANILGAPEAPEMSMDERLHHLFARLPEARVHLYGKGERPKRKIGHVNILGDDVAVVREKAERAAHWMSHAVWTDGWDPHNEH